MKAALPHLQLDVLGAPSVRVDGGPPVPDVLWRKHIALLAYLALSPGRTRTREHLLGMLWPEKPQDKARHSLNEAVRRLRASLGTDRLLTRGDALQLNDERLDVDAWRLREERAIPASGATEFLEGLVLDDAPAFETWLSTERDRVRSVVAGAVVREGEEALAEAAFRAAEDAARRALDVNPTSEHAAQLLLRALALAGDAAGALAAYHQFRRRLDEELGEEPSKELEALAERVRTDRWRRASASLREPDPPLVGRQEVHRTAFGLVEAGVRSGAQCLVVVGDPGMGKSRLVEECGERLVLSGASVVRARPVESDVDTPWSTLRILARSGLAVLPGGAGAETRAWRVLAGLVPELAERFPPAEAWDTADVATALRQVLIAASEEQPVGVLVDDAHLADGRSLGALVAAVTGLGTARVVTVFGVGSGAEHLPREVLHLMAAVGREIAGSLVRLDPLTHDETQALVRAFAGWIEDDDARDRLARRLTFEAGGSPFLGVTLLRGLDRTSTLKDDLMMWPARGATLEGPLPFSVPQLARTAVVARISQLDRESQQVLRAASIGGLALDPSLVAAMAELSASDVAEAVDRLEHARLVSFDGERYTFAASLVAQVVKNDCMTPGQRHRLRRRALDLLAGRDDLEGRVLRAELRAKVEPGPDAIAEAVRAAEAALDAGSDRTARRALAAAESASGKVGHEPPQLEQLRRRLGR